MSKKTKDTLTGGTGDVNPQYACISAIATANGAGAGNVAVPIVLPVLPNLASNSETAQVVELLKIYWDFGGLPSISTTQIYSYTSLRLAYNATTAALPTTSNNASIGNPLMIFETAVEQQGESISAAFGGGGFAYVNQHNDFTDLTDGAGHGILIAVPTIWFGVTISGWTSGGLAQGSVRILYRLKKVKLIEYIGIVQQQSGPQI
jgi:hypothetical protein